jgi:hypothetical protein
VGGLKPVADPLEPLDSPAVELHKNLLQKKSLVFAETLTANLVGYLHEAIFLSRIIWLGL